MGSPRGNVNTACACWFPRVHGSYEHLWAGQVADALVDLTGSLAERWSLKDIVGASGQQDRPSGGEHRTCRQLLRLKDQCLISCSVLSPRTGTTCGYSSLHHYLVTEKEIGPRGMSWLHVLLFSLLQREATLFLLDQSFHLAQGIVSPVLIDTLEAVVGTASKLTEPPSLPWLVTKQSPKPFFILLTHQGS